MEERKIMNQTGFYEQLCTILSKEQMLCKEPMSKHTTFRVGGPADYYVMPRTEQIAEVLSLCHKEQVPCHMIGNGSNLLVGDGGIRGVVLALSKQAAQVQIQGNCLIAKAGALLSQAAAAAYKAGLGGMQEEIWALMEDLKKRRIEKQPLEYPSAGSTFKRPKGNFAGKLIMEAGLAGVSVGGAQVSEKHCGFVVNQGHATAADIRELIQLVQKKVFEHSGIELETEVKYMGEFL